MDRVYSSKRRTVSLGQVDCLDQTTKQTMQFDSRSHWNRQFPDNEPSYQDLDQRAGKERSVGKYCFDERLLPLLVRLNMKCGERFASDDLREAVYALRKQVDKVKPHKNEEWTRFLHNFGDTSFIKSEELLEALFMLQNAYKKESFAGKETEKGKNLHTKDRNNNFSNVNRSSHRHREADSHFVVEEPVLTRTFTSEPALSLVDLVDGVDDTDVRNGAASSLSHAYGGSSTITVRRRPKRPEINVSTIKLNDPEPLVQAAVSSRVNAELMCLPSDSLEERKSSRCESRESETSYLDVTEDATQPITTKDGISYRSELLAEVDFSDLIPGHALAEIFQPLLALQHDVKLTKAIRETQLMLLPYLARLQELQEQSKGFDTLRVKLAVVQEEKKQLLGLLKQRRMMKQNASPMNGGGSTSSLSSSSSSLSTAPCSTETTPLRHADNGFAKIGREDRPLCHACKQAIDSPGVEKPKMRVEHRYESDLVKGDLAQEKPVVVCDSTVVYGSAPLQALTTDIETQTDPAPITLSATAHVQVTPDTIHQDTQTAIPRHHSAATMTDADLNGRKMTVGVQVQPVSVETGCDPMVDEIASQRSDQACQATVHAVSKMIATELSCREVATTAGCGYNSMRTVSTECETPSHADFCCGEGVVVPWDEPEITETTDASTSTVMIRCRDVASHCSIRPETVSVGVGTVKTVSEASKSNEKTSKSIGIGCYNDGEALLLSRQCCVDDVLCQCEKPILVSVGVGTPSLQLACDKCSNLQSRTIGVGWDRIDDLLCDRCTNRQTRSISCGDDTVDSVSCDTCSLRGAMVATGVGDSDVNTVVCDACCNRDMRSVACETQSIERHHVAIGECTIDNLLCDRCESRPALVARSVGGEDGVDDDLFCRICSERTVASIGVNTAGLSLIDACVGPEQIMPYSTDESTPTKRGRIDSEEDEFCNEVASIMVNSDTCSGSPVCPHCGFSADAEVDQGLTISRSRVIETVVKETATNVSHKLDLSDKEDSDEETEDEEQSAAQADRRKNDVIESCNMLKGHFNGTRRLTQKQMVQYIGAVEDLWFETARRKRVNTAMVKSYIDLFHSQIAELLETIVNLADDNGNTALHYALTYKNFGVVSILLDSNVCNVDLENKAGYTPIMLAALSGFESKSDKYIMQRLFRLGDINRQASETGQTPMMLAVSRGNLGVVEILMDAGAEVNLCDDDGSTALMCACEHGSIQIVKALLSNPDVDATVEDNEGSTALTIAMDAKRRDLALLIYGSLNFDARGRIKLSPSKQSLLGLGSRRSPSPVIGRM